MNANNNVDVRQASPPPLDRAELLALAFGQILAWRAERLAGSDGAAVVDINAGRGGVTEVVIGDPLPTGEPHIA